MLDRLYLLLGLSAVCCSIGHVSGNQDFSSVNANIKWHTLADIRAPDFNWAENKKPVMYLFTQPWCGACNRLKETMTEEGEGKTRMELFSKHYIMVSIDGKENDDLEEQFKPNGAAYIPRVLFAEPDGKVNPDLVNKYNSQYPYFFTSAPAVANAMEDFLPVFYPGYKKKKVKKAGDAKKGKCPFGHDADEDDEEDEDEYENVEDSGDEQQDSGDDEQEEL